MMRAYKMAIPLLLCQLRLNDLTKLFCLATTSFVCSNAYSIGHFDADRYYPLGSIQDYLDGNEDFRGGEVAPADLLAPRNMLMTNRGAMISPRWILGANHQSSGVFPGGEDVTVLIPKNIIDSAFPIDSGYYRYSFDVDMAISKQVLGNDHRLMRMVDQGTSIDAGSGAPATVNLSNLNYRFFETKSNTPIAGTRFVHGGTGDTYKEVNGTLEPWDGGAGILSRGLRWGGKRAGTGGSDDIKSLFSTADVLYEAHLRPGDSGSGAFYYDGWTWNTFDVVSTGSDIEGNRDTIYNELAAADPVEFAALNSQPLLDAPAAETAWVSNSQYVDWDASTANWSAGVPTLDNTVWVTGDAGSTAPFAAVSLLPGTSAEAEDLFVGVGGSSGELVGLGGDLTVKRSLFVGAEMGDGLVDDNDANPYDGTLWVANADTRVEARNLYVGYRGRGWLFQSAGEVRVDERTMVGDETQGTMPGRMELIGGASFETGQLVIGDEVGAGGSVELDAGSPLLTTNETIVGRNGTAAFLHDAGSHTTKSLQVGSGGAYTLQGGTLSVDGERGLNVDGAVTVSGGSLTSNLTRIEGTLTAAGGQIDLGLLSGDGTLDYANSGTEVSVEGFIDLTNFTIQNVAASSEVRNTQDGLLVISSQQATSYPTLFTSGSQPAHVAGTTLVIDQHRVSISGQLNDPVEVHAGGELVASTGGSLVLDNGLVYTGGTVNADRLIVRAGRNGVGAASSVVLGAGGASVGEIFVQSDGDLTVSGDGDSLSNNGGVVRIGDNANEELSVTSYFQETGNPELRIGIDDTGSDQLVATSTFPAGATVDNSSFIHIKEGKLIIEVDSNATINPGDYYEVMNGLVYGDDVADPLDSLADKTVIANDNVLSGNDFPFEVIIEGSIGATVGLQGVTDGNGDLIRVELVTSLEGDFDLDGVVDSNDFGVFNAAFGWQATGDEMHAADFNGDGVVDTNDFGVFNGNYNLSQVTYGGMPIPRTLIGSPVAPPPVSVPEPTSLLLIVVAGLLGLHRRAMYAVHRDFRTR